MYHLHPAVQKLDFAPLMTLDADVALLPIRSLETEDPRILGHRALDALLCPSRKLGGDLHHDLDRRVWILEEYGYDLLSDLNKAHLRGRRRYIRGAVK